MRRKASAAVGTPEKATPRRSTRGRGRRSPSKSPEPEPDNDAPEYGGTAAQEDKNNSSSEDESTSSRKTSTGKGRGRGSSTPRRKLDERPPSRARRNSRRDKEAQEQVAGDQIDENGGDNQDSEKPQKAEVSVVETPAEKPVEMAMEPILEEPVQEEQGQQDKGDGDSEEQTAQPETVSEAPEKQEQSSKIAEPERDPEPKAEPPIAEEKVSHTNGDEEESGEDDSSQAVSRDADDDSKEIVNNRSRTRDDNGSEESGQEDEGKKRRDTKEDDEKTEQIMTPAEESPHRAAEPASPGRKQEPAASNEEEQTAPAEEVATKVAELPEEPPKNSQQPQPQPRRRARFSSRPNDEPVVPASEPTSTAVVTVAEPPKKASRAEQLEEDLEAGEIKETESSALSEPQPDESTTQEAVAKEPPRPRPQQRKRRWLSSKNADSKPAVIAISTDSLKNIISDVKPVPLADVKLGSSSETEGPDGAAGSTEEDDREKDSAKQRKSQRDQQDVSQTQPSRQRVSSSAEKENIAMETDAPNGGEQQQQSVQQQQQQALAQKPKPVGEKIAIARKISIVSDDGSVPGTTVAPITVRPPSPAKHHASNILYITNLVRPFTVLQLKGLLARTGKIVENGFWIDKIKSKCYVKYETEDEATETRHALHGIRWPVSNPKCLVVDFGSEEAMEKAILSTLEDGSIRATVEGAKNSKEFGWSRDSSKKDEETPARPVREWDLGKKDTFDQDRDGRSGRDREGGLLGDERHREKVAGERERGRIDDGQQRDRANRVDPVAGERGADRKRSADREFGRDRRRSTSVSPARKFKKKENEPPIRLLDDLFRKTKATPCIYWLPLTTEQIAVKEEQRRKNMAEHQRRVEEQRKAEEERERERKRERERRDRERDRDRDRERERERDRDRDRDRRRSRSRERSRDDGGRRRHR